MVAGDEQRAGCRFACDILTHATFQKNLRRLVPVGRRLSQGVSVLNFSVLRTNDDTTEIQPPQTTLGVGSPTPEIYIFENSRLRVQELCFNRRSVHQVRIYPWKTPARSLEHGLVQNGPRGPRFSTSVAVARGPAVFSR